MFDLQSAIESGLRAIRAIRMIIDRVVSVIPAQAGVHVIGNIARLDSRLRVNDGHKRRESL